MVPGRRRPGWYSDGEFSENGGTILIHGTSGVGKSTFSVTRAQNSIT